MLYPSLENSTTRIGLSGTAKVPRCLSLVFVFLIAVLIYSLLFFRATIASWCHSSTFSCSQLFGDHLAAVRWNSRWPARSARSAASRRPPKPPKRPHCHLTRFLSWLCVRCAQQPRKFVWRLRIDADIKKNLHTNKTLFEPTFRIKMKPTTTTKNE